MTPSPRPTSPADTPPARRTLRERGQGSLESLAIFIVAGVLVAASVGAVTLSGTPFQQSVSYQICKLVNIADGGAGCTPPVPARTPEERIPPDPCVVGKDTNGANVKVSVVVDVQKGWTFITEEMSDGTYRVTRLDESKLGVGVGPGFDVSVTWDSKKYGLVGNVSADVFLGANQGDTWIVDSKGEADDLRNQLVGGEVVDQTVGSAPIVGDLISWGGKKLSGLEPPDSDETYYEGGVGGTAEAAVSNIAFGGQANADAYAYAGAKQTKDGYEIYVKGKISGSASMQAIWGASDTGEASAEGLWTVKTDKDGNPVSMTITTGIMTGTDGNNTLQQRTYEMPINDATRDIYERALWDPTAVDDVVQAAKDYGYASERNYDVDSSQYGANVSGKLIGEYGGGFGYTDNSDNLTDSSYWDGSDWVSNPSCTA